MLEVGVKKDWMRHVYRVDGWPGFAEMGMTEVGEPQDGVPKVEVEERNRK